MFEDILRDEFQWGNGDEVAMTPQTRAYTDLFAGTTGPGASVLVGLTTLWATERCYLQAWRFAKDQNCSDSGAEAGVLRRVLIPNWTSSEFEAFVDDIEKLLNELAIEEEGRGLGECEAVWKQVLWAERQFWPDVG